MKKTTAALLLLLLTAFMLTGGAGCDSQENKYDIVATLYPQYDIARQIAGDKLSVKLLVPFGTEIHGYEPTAKDIVSIKSAKLFLYTGNDMERWVSGITAHGVNEVNMSEKFTLVPYNDPSQSASDADTFHYWTDPTTILQLINAVKTEIIAADGENAEYYEENAQEYYNEIAALHAELETFFNGLTNPSVFFAGHSAMGAFGKRYNLTIRALTENYQPDADLTLQQLASIISDLETSGSHFIFTEELAEPRAANAVKKELAKKGYEVTLLELHGYHNITKKQNEDGITYADLLRQNLENLKLALNG